MEMFTIGTASNLKDGPTGHVTFYDNSSTWSVMSEDPAKLREFARSCEDAADTLEAMRTVTMTVPA